MKIELIFLKEYSHLALDRDKLIGMLRLTWLLVGRKYGVLQWLLKSSDSPHPLSYIDNHCN